MVILAKQRTGLVGGFVETRNTHFMNGNTGLYNLGFLADGGGGRSGRWTCVRNEGQTSAFPKVSFSFRQRCP